MDAETLFAILTLFLFAVLIFMPSNALTSNPTLLVFLLCQVPRTRHGGVGLYQCKDGYMLKGPNTTVCDFGNWTGITPRCELVYCPFPGYIDKGKVRERTTSGI